MIHSFIQLQAASPPNQHLETTKETENSESVNTDRKRQLEDSQNQIYQKYIQHCPQLYRLISQTRGQLHKYQHI